MTPLLLVARQFATGQKVLVIRNGWFSFRWTQIFNTCQIPSSHIVVKARKIAEGATAPYAPAPVGEVVDTILKEQPRVVFAPYVETSSGVMLPNDYISAVAEAVHSYGGMLVLDCVAAGCMWVNMRTMGVDVLISAPQKGWSASPCCGIVMLSDLAVARLETTTSTSFACDLKKWNQVMKTYEAGSHMYHATLPTDALCTFSEAIKETMAFGLDRCMENQQELGMRVRAALEAAGFPSVAATGFQAPGVVVSYTSDPDIKSGKKFVAAGMQIAAGVPLECDEGVDFSTFRIGLFGLEKLGDIEGTVEKLVKVLKNGL
jgi:aspartate aminotransferase-like enzyme